MGIVTSSASSDCHYQRALITRQITALENECKRLDIKIQAEEQRIIVSNRRGVSRQELKRHATTIKAIEKERKIMQKVVARLQSVSGEFIKAQSTELLNEHLSQLDDVISQINSQIVIPELKAMRKNTQQLAAKSKLMNEIIDENDKEDEKDEAEDEDDDDITNDEIIDRVLGPSLIARLDNIEVPTTSVKSTLNAKKNREDDRKAD